jgi:hypothetical protein
MGVPERKEGVIRQNTRSSTKILTLLKYFAKCIDKAGPPRRLGAFSSAKMQYSSESVATTSLQSSRGGRFWKVRKQPSPGIFDFENRSAGHVVRLGLLTGIVVGVAAHFALITPRPNEEGMRISAAETAAIKTSRATTAPAVTPPDFDRGESRLP